MSIRDKKEMMDVKGLLKSLNVPILSAFIATVLAAGALRLVKPFREIMLRSIEANALLITIAVVVPSIISVLTLSMILNRRNSATLMKHEEEIRSLTKDHQDEIRSLTEDIEEFKDISIRDVLTGAYNSNQINTMLDKRVEEAKLERKSFVLIMVDIDGFKRINDDYDHDVGNFVLRQFAREIRPRSSGDILIRYGGDEFLIISKLGTDASNGYRFAERLRKEVSEFEFLVEENTHKRENLTLSGGVTEYVLGEEDGKALLSRVAQALHLAKQPRYAGDGSIHGKNFVYVLSKTTE